MLVDADWLRFDGSCDPNPGGRMGWGWQITWRDGTTSEGAGEQARQPDNTVNVAEYSGLIAGLQAYQQAGGQGPLVVLGDSQLVIFQMQGRYKVNKPALVQLHRSAREQLALIPRAVSFRWERRESNTRADLLASGPGRANQQAGPRTIISDADQAALPAELRTAIARLNDHPAPGFGDLARLRVGGRDSYSRLGLAQLEQRAGPAACQHVRQALAALPEGEQAARQASVYRWVLRGLALELALRKLEVDAQIQERAQKRRA